ncbi:unnamed protein product [Candidula unifasciata]|uniref:Uncharacterized protein n=1 Tax=Candidula unifasciata TaxID=100452 RepID=A0A8S3YUB3_9EUPU|nr:unnamed protein product [Candidula unifasciata]
MDKWCALLPCHWSRDTVLLHWRKLLSGLVAVVSIAIIGTMCFCTAPYKREASAPCDAASSVSHEVPDTCPWQLVMSDLAHRLRLLEMAFKEQVVAREVIAAEVTNQSYSNLELERKLDDLMSAIKQLSHRLDKVKEQISEVSSRLYSDECLGFLVLMFVLVQIILALRTRLRDKQGQGVKAHSTQTHNGSTMNALRSFCNNSINGISWPSKQNVSFKQDACLVTFSKRTKEHISAQTDCLLAYVTDGIKFPIKQTFLIDSQDALKECPRAKVYLVFVDCQALNVNDAAVVRDAADANAGSCGGGGDTGSNDAESRKEHEQDFDFQMTSLRLLHLSGAHVILVLMNEYGSQQLADHALYNPNLPLFQSYDILQELASSGHVLSIWKDFSPHQLSYVKKIGRAGFNIKGK